MKEKDKRRGREGEMRVSNREESLNLLKFNNCSKYGDIRIKWLSYTT